jgi:hypothetical protein
MVIALNVGTLGGVILATGGRDHRSRIRSLLAIGVSLARK